MTIKQLLKQTDKTTIIKALEDFYTEGMGVRQLYEGRWVMCERFYKGSNINAEYIKKISNGKDLLPNINKTGYVHIENAIKPLVKQAMAIICDRMSSATVIPATNEIEDLQASIVAADFLKSREEVDDEIALRRDELTNLMVYGECARFTRYNPSLITSDNVVGDIETMTLDTSQYVRSSTDKRSSKPEWVITSEVYNVDVLQELYPGLEIKPDNVVVTKYGSNKLEQNIKTRDKCLVKRMYIRESKAFPKGSYYAWTGNTLLQGRDDLPDGMFPFVILQWLFIPGQAYPEGFVEPLIKPQITINDNLLKLIRLAEKKSSPPVLVAGSKALTMETIASSGQDVIHYNMGLDKPEFLNFSHDMQESYNLIQMAREEMMANAGLRETSLGRQPREATATQIASLKESDNLGIGYFKYAFERAYAQICYIKLRLAQKYFKQKRLIRTVGVNNEPNVRDFYGSDIKSVLDVVVKPTPYMTEAMKQNVLMQLITAGAFSAWQSAEDGLSKMTMIMNSGLNNARDIVDSILGDNMTFEQFEEFVGTIRNGKMTLETKQLDLADINAELQAVQMRMQYQQIQGGGMPMQGGGEQMQMPPEAQMPQEQMQNSEEQL